MNKTRLAKYATLALGAVGGVAIIVGGGLNQPVVMLAGLSAWALVALVLAYGNRLKLHNAVALHHMQLHVANQHSQQLQHLLSCLQQMQKEQDGLTRAAGDALHMQLRCHAGIQQTLDAVLKEIRIPVEESIAGENVETVGSIQRLWSALDDVATQIDSQHAHGAVLFEAFTCLQGAVDGLPNEIAEQRKALLEFIQQDANLIAMARRNLQWLKFETVQEVESLMQLQRMYPDTVQVPLLGGWAMDPAAMLSILKLIYEQRPSVIVECGSGTSSVWIAHALRSIGKGRLISLDQSPEFAAKTQAELNRLGLQDWVEVRVGELREVELSGTVFNWYDTAVLEGIDQVDVLIVDGPPGSTQPLARYPALPLVAHVLSNEACIIVDDATRKDEQKMMARWRREYPKLGKPQPMASRTRLMIWNDPQNAVGFDAGV